MQSNFIVLTVDVNNDGVTTTDVDQTYTRFEEHLNRSVYIGDNYSVAAPNTLSLYRTQPKPSGNFPGMAKSAFKFSDCLPITGNDGVTTLNLPLIVEVSFSIPVGATSAQVLERRQRVIALLDDDTVMNSLNMTLMV